VRIEYYFFTRWIKSEVECSPGVNEEGGGAENGSVEANVNLMTALRSKCSGRI
jgi:hypothetical protein